MSKKWKLIDVLQNAFSDIYMINYLNTIIFISYNLLQLFYLSVESRGKLTEELKQADAVVLTYACDKPSTLDRLSTFWLPELRRLEVCTKLV